MVESRPARRRRRRLVLVVVLVLLAAGFEWAVRAGEPKLESTAGVDTLRVPWHHPEPADFVDEVTHPWLPLRRGASWEFGAGAGGTQVWIEVAADPVQVAGISATSVRTRRGIAHVAQDRDGNVWLLGESVEGEEAWTVADGRPAGLVLPARLRRGDGYALVARADGTVLRRVQLDEREPNPEVTPVGTYDEAWALQVATVPQREGEGEYPRVVRVVLAKGVGPVRISSVSEGLLRLQAASIPGLLP